MASPALPDAKHLSHDFAERLVTARSRGERLDRPLAVDGPATAGKTATLEYLHSELLQRDGHIVPLIIGAPPLAPDAAPLVLMQLAEGLHLYDGVADRDIEEIADPTRPWGEKVRLVRSRVSSRAEDIVILCDEPLAWRDPGQPELADRVEDVWQDILFNGVGCSVVIAGKAPRAVRPEYHKLSAHSDPDGVIEQLRVLRPWADELRLLLGDELRYFSSLDLRLLVALAVVDGSRSAARWYETTPLAKELLALRLFERMRIKQEEWEGLLELWIYLACVRRPFEPALLEYSELYAALEPLQRSVLSEALLFQRGDQLVLHETLRTRVLSQLGESRTHQAHYSLADYFADRYADHERPQRRLEGMEAFDHASRVGRDDFARFPAFFVDQINLLGYRLSRRGRRSEAAEIFLRALQLDRYSDYANHYRAFNLDLLGQRPREVEKRYREAIRLNDRHPWWHSRLISFLVVRGKLEAARLALEAALPIILPADREPPPRIYRDVHLDIAANLVHRGQLDFASELLGLIPEHIAGQLEEYDHLRWIVDVLRYAEEHGQYVPLGVAKDISSWWVTGPFVVPAEPIGGEPLVRWLAGTIEDREDGMVHATMAEVQSEQGPDRLPKVGNLLFTLQQLEEWKLSDAASVLDVGDFIEIGFYGQDERIQRAARQPRGVGEVELPRVLGNPNRFLSGGLREG